MSNKKFFTYASLLALIAVPTVVEEVTAQPSAQLVYADELKAITKYRLISSNKDR